MWLTFDRLWDGEPVNLKMSSEMFEKLQRRFTVESALEGAECPLCVESEKHEGIRSCRNCRLAKALGRAPTGRIAQVCLYGVPYCHAAATVVEEIAELGMNLLLDTEPLERFREFLSSAAALGAKTHRPYPKRKEVARGKGT